MPAVRRRHRRRPSRGGAAPGGRYRRQIASTAQDRVTTADGVRLGVRRWSPQQETGTAIVLVHGFGSSKDAKPVGRVAEALAADGHLVVCPTARGHGESEGRCTLGDREHLDVAAAVGLARQDADRVVLVGASMGAIAVLRHGARERCDGVVAVSSPAEWTLPGTVTGVLAAGLTQSRPGRWLAERALGVRLGDWTDAPPPVELVATIAAPCAIVHGGSDRFIGAAAARRLHAAATGPCRLEIIEDMGHAFVPESVPAVRESVRWALAASDQVSPVSNPT